MSDNGYIRVRPLKRLILLILLLTVVFSFIFTRDIPKGDDVSHDAVPAKEAEATERLTRIDGVIKKGETFSDIFKRNGASAEELFRITQAARGVYSLNRLYLGRPYSIVLDEDNSVRSMTYGIDDSTVLNVESGKEGSFSAQKALIPYEIRTVRIGGTIKDNLIASMQSPQLAIELSDIFAWDIDFTTDLRGGDVFRVVAEELWLDGEFKKYGRVISASIVNDGRAYSAFRFETGGGADYYDEEGESLRRAFLKAPLSYRRISSGYSGRRYHPVLKRYRPHLGVDYAASRGTPVSSVGDGTVTYAGRKGQNGNMVIVRHPMGYQTYYGHLHKIPKGIRNGVKVRQGQVIGYVGSTGLATGPHLDYRVKHNGRFVNPLRLKLPSVRHLDKGQLAEFNRLRTRMQEQLASTSVSAPVAKAGESTKSKIN